MTSKKLHICENCGEVIINRYGHAKYCIECHKLVRNQTLRRRIATDLIEFFDKRYERRKQ